MQNYSRITRYILFGSIVFILVVLSLWYFFLKGGQENIAAFDSARGAGEAPSFNSGAGSTYQNLAQNSGFGGIVASLPLISNPSSTSNTPALPRLWQITKTPAAGGGFVERKAPQELATSSVFRFVERGTGYVFEANVRSGELARLTNTLVPRVYEALVAQNGALFLRSLDERGVILTARAYPTSTPEGGEGMGSLILESLPNNIRSIALQPNGTDILFLLPNNNGTVRIMRKASSAEPITIKTLGIQGWRLQWFPSSIVLSQYPAPNTTNYVYELRPNGELASIVPPARDLSVLPYWNASALLYSSGFALHARAGTSTSVVPLSLRTTADKCVWAPNATLIAYCAVPQSIPSFSLESWRQGVTHTHDAWWRIDVSASKTELLYAPENASIDVENPLIDSSGSYIVFMNRRDKTLWSLRIAE